MLSTQHFLNLIEQSIFCRKKNSILLIDIVNFILNFLQCYLKVLSVHKMLIGNPMQLLNRIASPFQIYYLFKNISMQICSKEKNTVFINLNIVILYKIHLRNLVTCEVNLFLPNSFFLLKTKVTTIPLLYIIKQAFIGTWYRKKIDETFCLQNSAVYSKFLLCFLLWKIDRS